MSLYAMQRVIKTVEVYEVEAKNGTDAGFKVAQHIADGGEPASRMTFSSAFGQARPVIEDEMQVAAAPVKTEAKSLVIGGG